MSLYHCSDCGEKTEVIDTRASHRRLRRRRKCKDGHRFSTMEVPVEAHNELKELIVWAGTQQSAQIEDMRSYIGQRIDEIFLGKPPPDS